MSSVLEFRAILYKDVALPSGLFATIRKIQAMDFIGLGDLPIPSSGETDSETPAPIDLELLKRYTDRALVCGVVQPLLTAELDDGGRPVCQPDALHVRELLSSDYQALSQAIMSWSGLTPEDAKAIEAFRPDGVSPARENDGADVSLAPV